MAKKSNAAQQLEANTRRKVELRMRLKDLKKLEKDSNEYLKKVRLEIEAIEIELGIKSQRTGNKVNIIYKIWQKFF
jgi:hypothetical protein